MLLLLALPDPPWPRRTASITTSAAAARWSPSARTIWTRSRRRSATARSRRGTSSSCHSRRSPLGRVTRDGYAWWLRVPVTHGVDAHIVRQRISISDAHATSDGRRASQERSFNAEELFAFYNDKKNNSPLKAFLPIIQHSPVYPVRERRAIFVGSGCGRVSPSCQRWSGKCAVRAGRCGPGAA